MKSLVVIFVVLIVGIIFIAIWDLSSSSTIDDTNYNEISWRLPVQEEIGKIETSFSNSELSICKTYYIKKFVGEKYLVACEDVGRDKWTYYTIYASQKKVYQTSQDLATNLKPPPMRQKQSSENFAEHANRLPVKPKPPVVNPLIQAK